MVQNNCNCRRGVNSSPPTAPEATEMGRFSPLFYLSTTWSRPVTNLAGRLFKFGAQLNF